MTVGDGFTVFKIIANWLIFTLVDENTSNFSNKTLRTVKTSEKVLIKYF